METEFRVPDLNGNLKSKFTLEETMIFKYALRNFSEKDLIVHSAQAGPFVQFIFQKGSVLVKDSFYGFGFLQVLISYLFSKVKTINENRKTGTRESMTENYIAKAIRRFITENDDVPPELTKSFTVY